MTKKVEPTMTRDTDILNGTLTFEDRRKIDKEWAKARQKGLLGFLAPEKPRKKK